MAKPNSDTAQLLASPRSSQPGRGSQFDRLLAWFVCHKFDSTRDGCLVEDVHYIIRKYLLPIWSEHNYIFSHRIVHWVYNYMFSSCILTIVRLYCKLNTYPIHILYSCLLSLQYNLTMANIQGRNM